MTATSAVTGLNGAAGYLLGTGSEIQGILVLANVFLASIQNATGGPDVLHQAVFGIQADIGGVYTTLPSTVRFVSQGARYLAPAGSGHTNLCDIDVSLRVLINTDTAGVSATTQIDAVRLIATTLDLTGAGGQITIVIQRGNLTVIPLHMLKG